MHISKNSIKAIILTIILFLSILFVSLFKGIYLYDIKLKNIYIKKIFFKIDNKIVLKIKDVKINSLKSTAKKPLNIYKIALSSVKILKFFKELSLHNIQYENISIKNIDYKDNKIKINSDFVNLTGVLNKNSLSLDYIKIYDYVLKHLKANFYKNNRKIVIKAKGEYNNFPLSFNIDIFKNNLLKISLNADKFIYKDNSIFIDLSNINARSDIDLNNLSYPLEGNFSKGNIKYLNTEIFTKKSSFRLSDNIFTIKSKSITLPTYQNIKNIQLLLAEISYNLKNAFTTINSPEISAQYTKFTIKSFENNLSVKTKNDIAFFSTKTVITDNNNTVVLKNNILNYKNNTLSYIIKTALLFSPTLNLNAYNLRGNLSEIFIPKIYAKIKDFNITLSNTTADIKKKNYTVSAAKVISKDINLKTSKIKGNLSKIFIPKINGKIYGFNATVTDAKINIKSKTASAKKAVYNNVKAYNIKYADNKIIFYSNSLFDRNIKNILKKLLDIDVPVVQIKGKNHIETVIKFNNNIESSTRISTYNSILKLFDFNLTVPQAKLHITNTELTFDTYNSKLDLAKDIKLKYSGKGFIDFIKGNLTMNGKVDFKIEKIINLKNFKENIRINFDDGKLYAKNSHLFIDFKLNQLIINPLKPLLPFTPFDLIVKNGIMLVTLGKTTKIITYFLFKHPLFFKHANTPVNNKDLIERMFLYIKAGDDINISNKKIHITIRNSKIKMNLNTLDINLYPLEKLLNNKNSKNSNTSYTIDISTVNSNIIYKMHKFLSEHANLHYDAKKLTFNSVYKKSSVKGYTKNNYLLLEGKNFSTEEFNAFMPKLNFFSFINLDFIMVKSPDNFYTGKIYINKATVRELKSLNNIIAFINTVPSLLSLSSPGFSAKGYKIKNGYINYLLYKKILYIKQAKIIGKNIDFYAKGYIDFNKNYIYLKTQANLKMKYKKIPIIGKGMSYLFFGKDGNIDIKMVVKGNLNNPEVKKDIGKEILLSPFKLFQRAITLPFNLF